jgi:hypothetical protein
MPWRSKGELTLSLRTRSFREAQWLAASLDHEFERIIASVNEKTTTPDIQRIARDYLKRKLAFDMERRTTSPHRAVYNAGFDPRGSSASDLEWVEGELQTARTELRERLYEHQRQLIDEIMEAHAVPSEMRGALAHAVFEANVAAWETIRERTLGKFSSEEREPPIEQSAPKLAKPAGPLLSAVLPNFYEFMSKQEGWRGHRRCCFRGELPCALGLLQGR